MQGSARLRRREWASELLSFGQVLATLSPAAHGTLMERKARFAVTATGMEEPASFKQRIASAPGIDDGARCFV